jgi:hypothetical protein
MVGMYGVARGLGGIISVMSKVPLAHFASQIPDLNSSLSTKYELKWV